MSGGNSILKRFVQSALIILMMVPVILPMILTWAGWNFMFVRQVMAVLILILWTPLTMFAVYTGVARLVRTPANAGFNHYLDVAHRIGCGSMMTVGSVYFVVWLLSAR